MFLPVERPTLAEDDRVEPRTVDGFLLALPVNFTISSRYGRYCCSQKAALLRLFDAEPAMLLTVY